MIQFSARVPSNRQQGSSQVVLLIGITQHGEVLLAMENPSNNSKT